MDSKRGLGRGLSALMEEAGETQAAVAPAAGKGAPVELIHANPNQPRRLFRADEIDSLAASIREKGILQPILVRPAPGNPGHFQIVAGERRWRAAQQAGLHEVPVIVRELDDAEALEIAVLENIQRVDLNPLEESAAYQTLIEQFGHTQEAISKAVGKSRSHVANSLRLLNLPAQVRVWIVEDRLSAGHGRALLAAADPVALAEQVIARGLSVRETEALAQKERRDREPSEKRRMARIDADTTALERRLSEALGLVVTVWDAGGKGEVRIRYATLEQLEDVTRKLGA